MKLNLYYNYLFNIYKSFKKLQYVSYWKKLGKPVPPPHSVKVQTVLKFASSFDLKIFIETGTYKGAMIEAVKNSFNLIYSIELSETLYNIVINRFKGYSHIKLFNGDSSHILRKILQGLKSRALFWLDAHYSGGETAKGITDTPIIEELTMIFQHSTKDHVILIDDARLFNGLNSYPSMKELVNFVSANGSNMKIYIQNDIICITLK
jgi:hypothetical protein